MASQNNLKTTNFWFGFSLGIMTSAMLLYLFGTKKGRENLKKLLELTENIEENLSLITEELDNISFGDEKEPTKKVASTISTILNKVKSLSP